MRIDLRRDRPDLYLPGSPDFVEVDVPPTTHLAIDGHGDPDSRGYTDAVGALYAAGYAVRSAFRTRTGDDFVVAPLGGLWSSADPSAFARRARDEWDWTLLIPLPDVVVVDDVTAGLAAATLHRPRLPVGDVGALDVAEGRSLQVLHVGSYDSEGPVLARLHDEVMPARGLTWNGPHHEIYLSDPRRVAPDRLRTVLRQPVRPAG